MSRQPLRIRVIAAVFSGGLCAVVSPAFAAEPVETALRTWIAALDASPNWVAGFDTLTYDDASRTATLKNLTIRSETLTTKMEISFGSIAVTGYGETADGGFTVTGLKADDSRIVIGAASDITLKSITADTVAVPSFASYSFDPSRMFTSMVKAYAIAAQTTIGALKIDSLDAETTFEGQTSRSSYGAMELTNMSKGVIDRVSMGPFKQESPAPDGLVTLRADKLEALKMDLNALVDVFDADRYVGGVGDRTWRTAIALESYTNLSADIPGGSLRVGSVELENLKLRQPPKSFTPLFDRLLANPAMDEKEAAPLVAEYLPDVFYAFGFGAFRFSDVDITAPEVERFHLGDFHLTDLSSDGLGEFGIADLDVAADKSSIGAERIAFGGMVFPGIDRVSAAVKASQAGIEADPLPLMPTLGFGEAVNVSVVQDGKTVGALDRGRLDLSGYIGPVPTSVALDLRGINLDLSQVTDPKAREMIAGLGYDRLLADYGFKLNWREADESLSPQRLPPDGEGYRLAGRRRDVHGIEARDDRGSAQVRDRADKPSVQSRQGGREGQLDRRSRRRHGSEEEEPDAGEVPRGPRRRHAVHADAGAEESGLPGEARARPAGLHPHARHDDADRRAGNAGAAPRHHRRRRVRSALAAGPALGRRQDGQLSRPPRRAVCRQAAARVTSARAVASARVPASLTPWLARSGPRAWPSTWMTSTSVMPRKPSMKRIQGCW